MRPACLTCFLLWSALAGVAYFWPWLIVWLLAGVVLAVIFFALASNPIPKVRLDARHVFRPDDADTWGEPRPRARRAA